MVLLYILGTLFILTFLVTRVPLKYIYNEYRKNKLRNEINN